MSGKEGKVRSLHGQRVDIQSPNKEKSEARTREEEAGMTPIGDVNYRVYLSTKIAAHDKTP